LDEEEPSQYGDDAPMPAEDEGGVGMDGGEAEAPSQDELHEYQKHCAHHYGKIASHPLHDKVMAHYAKNFPMDEEPAGDGDGDADDPTMPPSADEGSNCAQRARQQVREPMINPQVVLKHPANRLALQCLKAIGEPRGHGLPMLRLAEVGLRQSNLVERVKVEKLLPHLENLREQSPVVVASRLIEDFQQLNKDMMRAPQAKKESLLKEELDSLYRAMREAPSVQEAAWLLACNLSQSLQVINQGLGPLPDMD
jgi:hypothetical protein